METLATTIQEKEIKVINIGNEDTKLPLFTADMFAYGQNPIEFKKIKNIPLLTTGNAKLIHK